VDGELRATRPSGTPRRRRRRRVVAVAQPVLGQHDVARALHVPARQRLRAGRQLGGRVERVEQLVELGERGRHRQRLAGGAADGVAGEVPAGVPAEVAHGEALVAAGLDQRAGVPLHDRARPRDRRRPPAGRPAKASARSRNSHGPPEAAAADDDAVAAGLGHHPQGVVGGPDVAVAEHRDAGERLLERRDGRTSRRGRSRTARPCGRAGRRPRRPRPAPAGRPRGR
jgi:hypothetical protein